MSSVETIAQENKARVWRYWQQMNGPCASFDSIKLDSFLHPEARWFGFEPLASLQGADQISQSFWRPLHKALPDLMRRPYCLMGGRYHDPQSGDGDWVCATGDLIGTFARDWLVGSIRIPASGHSVRIRFGEFCKLEAGRIVEIRCLLDLPDLLRQVGITLLPPSYGRDSWVPGPLTADGVCFERPDAHESRITFDLVTEMIFGGLNKYDGNNQDSQGLENYWHKDMVWHGPLGIGSAYGLDEFKQNAQGPIVHAFPDRRGAGHQARIADGVFAASTGWPSLVGTHQQPYMNWQPTGERIGWNIMDFWRRDGNKLRENWVMIDLVGAAMQSQVDLLQALRG